MGLGEDQDGGVANKGREEGSGERAVLATDTRMSWPVPGAWMRGKRERKKICELSLRNVLCLGESPWREVVTRRERDTEEQGL